MPDAPWWWFGTKELNQLSCAIAVIWLLFVIPGVIGLVGWWMGWF